MLSDVLNVIEASILKNIISDTRRFLRVGGLFKCVQSDGRPIETQAIPLKGREINCREHSSRNNHRQPKTLGDGTVLSLVPELGPYTIDLEMIFIDNEHCGGRKAEKVLLIYSTERSPNFSYGIY